MTRAEGRVGLAVLFHGPGRALERRRLSVGEPGAGELLVRVTACTLCGSDLHTFHGRRGGPSPAILGHEILGTIESFGSGAPRADWAGRAIAEGDRVTWSVAAGCGDCFFCGVGMPQKCDHLFKYGHERHDDDGRPSGGLADHCVIRRGTAVVRVPEHVPDEVACPASCATATVAAAMEAAGEPGGRSLLILGAGMLGLTAAAMAREGGASAVVVCDPLPDRLALARAFGATVTADADHLQEVGLAATGGRGFDAVLEFSGANSAFESSLGLARIGGTIVLVGAVFPSAPVPVAVERLVRRCLTIRGVHNYAPGHLSSAVEFLSRSNAPFAGLVSGWRPLDRAEEAFEIAADPGVLRAGIRPWPEASSS